MPRPPQPNLPDETWSVNKEEKDIILDFGRKFTKFVFDFAKEKGGKTFHTKLVAGAFQYFMEIQRQKNKLIGDDVLIAQETIERYGLGDKIEEPFQEPEPIVVPTKEEQIAELKKQIEDLEKPEGPIAPAIVDKEVEDAMNSPEHRPIPMEGDSDPLPGM